MSFNFLKEDFNYLFEGNKINISSLDVLLSTENNGFILNHNISAIENILNFLKNSDKNIFILNGFMGAGKTYVADFVLDFIPEDVLIFRNSYREAINTDDILLSMFKDFSIYHNEKQIILPKTDTNVFSEKIITYIKYCNAPMLFIFDSFEINMRNKDTQKDILDFINYLSRFEKIKILICSRSFHVEDLISSNVASNYSIVSLSQNDVFNYLNENSITGTNFEIEEFYKATRGHYLLLELSVLIIQLLNYDLNLFLNEYKKSTKNFLDFLIDKILKMTSDKYIKLLVFLSLIRHGVNSEFLIFQQLAQVDDIEFLIQKRVLTEKFGKYYLKDYIRNEFTKSISIETKLAAHNYLIQIYENELPLKPFERPLFLSRQTMRQEIAYHKTRIATLEEESAKTGRAKKADGNEFNYLRYSKISGYDNEVKAPQQSLSAKRTKRPAKINNFSDNDSLLLNVISKNNKIEKEFENISGYSGINSGNLTTDTVTNSTIPQTMDEYIEIAENYFKAYNYSNAITYFNQALLYSNEPDYEVKSVSIFEKLALCHKKIQNTDEAEKFYNKIYSTCVKTDLLKAINALISSAKMYSETYKFDKAKEIYNRILYSDIVIPDTLKARIFLDTAEIEDNNTNFNSAILYVKKAVSIAEKLSDNALLAECYFKYALFHDDINDLDTAVTYYLRCIQSLNNPAENHFISSAYSNLAEISMFNKNISAAKMYYELSINADETQNNYEGLYYTHLKFASVFEKDDPQKAFELLSKALTYAKKTDDVRFVITAYLSVGDFYLLQKDLKNSLKSYCIAKTFAPKNAYDELNQKLELRFEKIKSLISHSEYDNLLNDIKNKK